MGTGFFYTVAEAAKKLNSNEQTIRRLIASKELTATKKLGKWYIFHKDIVDFINS